MGVRSPGVSRRLPWQWEREKPPSEHRKQHWVLKQWCWEFSFPLRGAPAARCHEATQAGSALRVEREEGC